jgi:hypothetical protein
VNPSSAKTGSIRLAFSLTLILATATASAHGVAAADANFLESLRGVHLSLLAYLGAKHMFTGYDHILFLLGVIFFLSKPRDIFIYATLFALGHSITLLTGTLANFSVNIYLVDALIGLSVVYKALDNIENLRGRKIPIDTHWAVFLFGLVHGLGLSSKLQDLNLSKEGIVANIVAFNVGVELGQIAALTLIYLALNTWRQSPSFNKSALTTNMAIMVAGCVLIGFQLTGYFVAA